MIPNRKVRNGQAREMLSKIKVLFCLFVCFFTPVFAKRIFNIPMFSVYAHYFLNLCDQDIYFLGEFHITRVPQLTILIKLRK